MKNIIDTRGLSCPQPVMATLDALADAKQGTFTILVDTDTSRENVMRAVEKLGWDIKNVQPDGTGFALAVAKA